MPPDFSILEVLKTGNPLVWKVSLSNGATGVLRLYSPQQVERARLLEEAGAFWSQVDRCYPDWLLGIPTDLQTLPFDPATQWPTSHAVLSRWTPGDPIKSLAPLVCECMGRTLAQIHECAVVFDRRPALPHLNGLFLTNVGKRIQQAPLFKTLPRKSRQALTHTFQSTAAFLENYPATPLHYGPIHTDAHTGNWVLHSETAVPIDFDYTAYGHYLTDLAVLLWDIARQTGFHFQKNPCAEALLQGYTSVRLLPAHFEEAAPCFLKVAAALYLNWSLDPDAPQRCADPAVEAATREAIQTLEKF